jgi:hypothetical protein
MSIQQLIISSAYSFLGETEISGNKGFKSERFQQLMESVGWQVGQAWCSYFAEMIWKDAYSQYNITYVPVIDKLFSAGAVNTWNNFRRSGIFVCDHQPERGSVVIWQNYKYGQAHWTGHAGIVCDIHDGGTIITTIEGNTNSHGGREGIEVARHERSVDFSAKEKGLVLKGFIHSKI